MCPDLFRVLHPPFVLRQTVPGEERTRGVLWAHLRRVARGGGWLWRGELAESSLHGIQHRVQTVTVVPQGSDAVTETGPAPPSQSRVESRDSFHMGHGKHTSSGSSQDKSRGSMTGCWSPAVRPVAPGSGARKS